MPTITPLGLLHCLALWQGLDGTTPDTTPKVVPIIENLGFEASEITLGRNGLIFFVADRAIRVYDPARRVTSFVDSTIGTDLTVSPRGDQLAFARGEPLMSVWTLRIDPATGRRVSAPRRLSVTSGRAPAFSPDGKWVAFSVLPSDSADGPRIVRVSSSGGAESVLSREPGFAQDLHWSQDGRWVYYRHANPTVQSRRRTLHRVRGDGTRHAVIGTIGLFVGLSSDGHRLAYLENDRPRATDVDKILVIADTGGRFLRRYTLPPFAVPSGWGPGADELLLPRSHTTWRWRAVDLNGRIRDSEGPSGAGQDTARYRLRFANLDTVIVMDRSRQREIRLPECEGWLGRRDSTLLCLGRGPGTRRVLSVDLGTGKSTVARTLVLPEHTRPGIHLFGDTTLAVVHSGRIMLTPLAGGELRTIHDAGALALNDVSLSPDGQWIAAVVEASDGTRPERGLAVRIVSVATGSVRSIPLPTMNVIIGPFWDPQQRYVAIQAETGPRSDIWIVPLNGDAPSPITRAEPGWVPSFSVGTDGNELHYGISTVTSSIWTIRLPPQEPQR